MPRASTAPAVSALVATPGDSTVPGPSWPRLPAATTNSVPSAALSESSPCDTGSVPSSQMTGELKPRLMLTIFACCAAAHCMPAMTCDSVPLPSSARTFPISSWAPVATPWCWPPDAVPEPAMIDAVQVPWPSLSWMPSAEPVKSADPATTPWRSGLAVSYPVSRSATRTPCPVRSASRELGAGCAAVAGRQGAARRVLAVGRGLAASPAADTRPSSHTFATCGVSASGPLPPAAGRVRLTQNCAALAFASLTAAPSMLGRARVITAMP